MLSPPMMTTSFTCKWDLAKSKSMEDKPIKSGSHIAALALQLTVWEEKKWYKLCGNKICQREEDKLASLQCNQIKAGKNAKLLWDISYLP